MASFDLIADAAALSVAQRRVKPFLAVAKSLARSDFNSPVMRAQLFDSGAAACMLEALASLHGLHAVDASHALPTEIDSLRTARFAMIAGRAEEEAARSAAANVRASKKTAAYWAAGTGYGFGGDDSYYGEDEDGCPLPAPAAPVDGVNDSATKHAAEAVAMKHTSMVLETLIAALEPCAPVCSLPESALPVLAASAFVPLLKALLRQSVHLCDSHPDVVKHAVRATRVCAVQPSLRPLLYGPSHSLCDVFKEHASLFVLDDAPAGADESPAPAPLLAKLLSTLQLLRDLDALAPACAVKPPPPSMDEEHAYAAALKAHQFGSMSLDSGAPSADGSGAVYRHHYASYVSSEASSGSATTSKLRTTRITKELRTLRGALPLSAGSSVFVRHDKKRPHVMKVMIAGPEDTPYDAGLFLFDVFCPADYPSVPPKVNLMTTGGGSVRFNPNLYNCGKVCLSLLGTWSGGAGEGWGADSTLLQVFVSIQALILVKEPYFNEPGVESSMGCPSSVEQSRHSGNGGYERLRVSNIRFAMIDAMRNPAPGFESVVKAHFLRRREHIKATAAAWIADATSTRADLTAAVVALERELDALAAAASAEDVGACAAAAAGEDEALPSRASLKREASA